LLSAALLSVMVAASVTNGLASSPLFDPVQFYLGPLLRPILRDPDIMFRVNSIYIALMTLALAGIPAAIYERARGLTASTPVSIAIWLSATILLSVPGLLGAAGYFDADF